MKLSMWMIYDELEAYGATSAILSGACEITSVRVFSFEESDSTQIAVLTIPTLQGESLEEYSLKVAERWGIGQKGKDNGALLLIAQAEHKLRIEVGYGLEGRLTDLLAGRIIKNEIAPRFKQGDYDGGVIAGVAAMMEAVRGEYQGSGRTTQKKRRNPFGLLVALLFFGPFLLRVMNPGVHSRGHRSRGFWIGGPPAGGAVSAAAVASPAGGAVSVAAARRAAGKLSGIREKGE